MVQQSLVSVKYLDWLFRLPLQTTSTLLCRSWAVKRYPWRRFSACWCLIDLNRATWHCQSLGGSIKVEFVGASIVTSGWRGVVTSLCLFGSSSPDHTRSLKKQRSTQRQSLYRCCQMEAVTSCSRKVLGHCFFCFYILDLKWTITVRLKWTFGFKGLS